MSRRRGEREGESGSRGVGLTFIRVHAKNDRLLELIIKDGERKRGDGDGFADRTPIAGRERER